MAADLREMQKNQLVSELWIDKLEFNPQIAHRPSKALLYQP